MVIGRSCSLVRPRGSRAGTSASSAAISWRSRALPRCATLRYFSIDQPKCCSTPRAFGICPSWQASASALIGGERRARAPRAATARGAASPPPRARRAGPRRRHGSRLLAASRLASSSAACIGLRPVSARRRSLHAREEALLERVCDVAAAGRTPSRLARARSARASPGCNSPRDPPCAAGTPVRAQQQLAPRARHERDLLEPGRAASPRVAARRRCSAASGLGADIGYTHGDVARQACRPPTFLHGSSSAEPSVGRGGAL